LAAAHKEAHNTRNVENDFGSQNVGLECASLLCVFYVFSNYETQRKHNLSFFHVSRVSRV
jgi:hypothetical protein